MGDRFEVYTWHYFPDLGAGKDIDRAGFDNLDEAIFELKLRLESGKVCSLIARPVVSNAN